MSKFKKGDLVDSVDRKSDSRVLRVLGDGPLPDTFWASRTDGQCPVELYRDWLWKLVSTTEGESSPNQETEFSSETRVTSSTEMYTDPNTGGRKEKKTARYDLIPTGPLWKVAEMYGIGASKYDERNWEKSYPMSLSYASMQRHANQFWSGEDNDQETGIPHLASVVFHAMAMMEFLEKHPEQDDRP